MYRLICPESAAKLQGVMECSLGSQGRAKDVETGHPHGDPDADPATSPQGSLLLRESEGGLFLRESLIFDTESAQQSARNETPFPTPRSSSHLDRVGREPSRGQEEPTSRGIPVDTVSGGSRGDPRDQGRHDVARGDPFASSNGTLGLSHRHNGAHWHDGGADGQSKRLTFLSKQLQNEREASFRRLHKQLAVRATSLPDLTSLCHQGLLLNGSAGVIGPLVCSAQGSAEECQGGGFASRTRHHSEPGSERVFPPVSLEADDITLNGPPTPFAGYRAQPRWNAERPRDPGGPVLGGFVDLESPLRLGGPPGFVLRSMAGEAPLTTARSGAGLSTISSRELSSMESARYSDNPFS